MVQNGSFNTYRSPNVCKPKLKQMLRIIGCSLLCYRPQKFTKHCGMSIWLPTTNKINYNKGKVASKLEQADS